MRQYKLDQLRVNNQTKLSDMAMQIKVFDLHQIVIGIGVSLILFLIGTCIGKAQDEEVLRVFFPERYPD